MFTAQEALFRDMLFHEWFAQSDGNSESPQGFFGYITNTKDEINEILEAFEYTVDTYGRPADNEIVGSWVARIDSNGIIHIYKMLHNQQAKDWFDGQVNEFNKWLDTDSEDV